MGAVRAADRKLHGCHRKPLVLRLEIPGKGATEILIAHTKSKYSLLKKRKQWVERDEAAILDALLVRAKLSAEAQIIRSYLESSLDSGDHEMIVMGDLNDGPFFDRMEAEFLIHNIVDELVGTLLKPSTYLTHAMRPAQLERPGPPPSGTLSRRASRSASSSITSSSAPTSATDPAASVSSPGAARSSTRSSTNGTTTTGRAPDISIRGPQAGLGAPRLLTRPEEPTPPERFRWSARLSLT